MTHRIPSTWSRIWMALHKPTGEKYVIGRTYQYGTHRADKRYDRWKIVRLWQTPKGNVYAEVRHIDAPGKPMGGVGLHAGSEPEAWTVETDTDRNTYVDDRCTFCRREVMVRPYNRRARDKCPCGARHFMRLVRQGGKIVAEEEGWRKNGKEWIRI